MTRISEVFILLRAILAEIFEEAPYSRFLLHHNLEPSREAYALYLRESNATRERRPRCC